VGYHVEAQKQQVIQLEEQNRELRLSEAQLTNPGRIDKMAKQLGLDAPAPGQVVRPENGDPNAPVLAQAGSAGPTGPTGAAAAVSVGTVTTGSAGSQASVTNSGTAGAAVLNFTIPQGAPGTGGGGGGAGTSGIPFASTYHGVSFNNVFYSVNNANESLTEVASVLTWAPAGCTATTLSVFSQQSNTILVTLRQGTPTTMADTTMACSVTSGSACTVAGSVAVGAGNFVDLRVSGAGGTSAGVWMALACN